MKGILYQLLGLALTAITGIRLEGGDLVLSVRPRKGRGLRCPECGRRCARYDAGRGPAGGGRSTWRPPNASSSTRPAA